MGGKYTPAYIAQMAANAKAKIRHYADRRDALIREGMFERDAQRQATQETNALYPSRNADDE